MLRNKYNTVDEYLSALPPDVKKEMSKLRKTIKQIVPKAEEVISYNMPAFKYNGMLVYYAAHKNHIGFYPGNRIVNEVFRDDLKDYKTSKGSIQFPHNMPVPLNLVRRIVIFRAKENLDKAINKLKISNGRLRAKLGKPI
jgi:uncharacterized protein YdhG (YjbR/CyaY superfamily)